MRRRTKRAYRALLWLLLAALLAAAGVAGLHLWQLARDKARAERLLWEMRQTALSAQTDPVQTDAPFAAASGMGGTEDGKSPGAPSDAVPNAAPDAASTTAPGAISNVVLNAAPDAAADAASNEVPDAPPDITSDRENGLSPDPSPEPAAGTGDEPLPEQPPAAGPGADTGAEAGQEQPVHVCPIDFAALRARYPDVTAWLTGCGGAIDTPVVQGTDNAYYLDHLPDGTRNRLGAAFLDSENQPSFTDDQSFLFGHHMDAGSGVFSPLLNYQDAGYWREAPEFTLHTPDGCYSAEVFAAFVIQERAYPYQMEFSSADAMRSFLNEVCARSQIETSVHPTMGDRVLTLCTCTSKTNDLRYMVCTRLVPLTDSEA